MSYLYPLPPPVPSFRRQGPRSPKAMVVTRHAAAVSVAIGFVLVRIRSGKELAVYEALQKVAEVLEVHPLFGEFDLIAKVEADDFDSLGHTIVTRIRAIDGVADTKTLTEASFGPAN